MTIIEKLKKAFKYTVFFSLIYFITFMLFMSRFGGFYIGLIFAIVLTFLLSIISFITIFSLLDSKKREPRKKKVEEKKELTPFEYKIKISKSNIIKIKKACDAINNSNLKKQVDEFIIKSNRILSMCSEENEKELASFFEFCIPTVLELVQEFEKYTTLDIRTEEAKNFKIKVIHSIDEINDRITSIESTFIQRTTERIDVSVKTLNTILELDGYEAITKEEEE